MSRSLIAVVGAALFSTAAMFAQSSVVPASSLRHYELPAAVTFPEGVAYDSVRGVLYTSNAETGTVIRLDPKAGTSEVVVTAGAVVPSGTTTFPAALGMKVDSANRLWIAGGVTGRMSVVDIASGRMLKQVQVPNSSSSLINDVEIVETAAYFTDSRTPTMWRMTAAGAEIGDLEPWLNFAGTPLQYDAGLNLNGIVATPDGRSLIVVQMDKGLLFRIDIATKRVHAIDTGGADLSGGDGLVLDGTTLYVVRQPGAEIVTVALSADLTSGSVVSRFKDAALAWPATAVKVGDSLIVVNSQFNTRATKTQKAPFSLLAVPLSRLAPAR